MKIGILGAGSIGGYVGGCLAVAGADVCFVGRSPDGQEWVRSGLQLTDLYGRDEVLPAESIRYSANADVLSECDLVLVTVKSGQTADAAARLTETVRRGTTVLSLQNGIRNGAVLTSVVPACRVLRGMFPMNVVWRSPRHVHCGTGGTIVVEDDPVWARFAPSFRSARLPLERHAEMEAVQWAKLLMNLNNAINALSGLPLREQLADRNYRRCLALAQREALCLLKAEGRIRPAKLSPIPPGLMPVLLQMPDLAFRLIAGRALRVDATARSSMADDLQAGRSPEVDWINGEVVALAEKLGLSAPVNSCLCKMVHNSFRDRTPPVPSERLFAELRVAA